MTHMINNRWCEGLGAPFTSHDAAKLNVIWRGNAAIAAQVDSAVAAARTAFVDLPLGAIASAGKQIKVRSVLCRQP